MYEILAMFKERTYIMSSQIGYEKVIQVRCSPRLWPALGWRSAEHPCVLSGDRLTSLVMTPWAYERQPLGFLLVCAVKRNSPTGP